MALDQTVERDALAGEQFARDFAERWQVAWNSLVPERVTELCTEDVVWDDPLTERPEHGRDAVAEYLRNTWRTFPDLNFTWPEGPYASFEGIKLALHWRVTGTMQGPAHPQGFAGTGKSVRADGVDLIELRNGLCCNYVGFFDTRAMAQQVGILPKAGSPIEKATVAVHNLLRGRR